IIDGKNLDDLNDIECSEFRNRKLGFIFQSFHLLPRMNLIRNAEIPMIYAQVKPVIRKKRVLAMLSAVGLEDRTKHFPPQLSGGQCQRAAIARALVNNPSLLLADEPTGNLDSKTGIEIIGIFQALNRQGMTIVMVTHDEGMAMYAQSIIRMRDGRVEKVEKVEKPLKSELPVELESSLKEALNEVF
ncbi:MAG: ATP-binding cassette domain-containing protein, partial [Candidatus Riflebacteria bacterium]|nr:ATP-binding cassette domain-containing protein [Candidatus Riflebacteria bacterium]